MAIINPIFQRELKTAVRDPKTVFLVLAFLVMLSVVLIFLWPRTGVFSQATNSSMQIFSIFLMSNLALIILLVPALTSSSITSERENNSYALLFTSLLTPGEILRGKLFSAIAMIVLVVLVSLPVSALCALSGGIGPAMLGRAFSVILMSALTYGLVGLAISALCRTTFTALVATYATVAFFAGCTWLPYFLLRVRGLGGVLLVIRCLSPFDALSSVLYPERYGLTQVALFTENHYAYYYIYMLGNAALLAFCLFLFCRYVITPPNPAALYRGAGYATLLALVIFVSGQGCFAYKLLGAKRYLSRSLVNPYLLLVLGGLLDFALLLITRWLFQMARQASARYKGQFTDLKTAAKRKLSWPFYLIDPLKRKKPIGRFRNPVFIAEMRSKIFARPRFIIYGLTTCIGISMLLLILTCVQFGDWLSPDKVRLVAIVFQIGIVAILAPAISSGAITDEITSRTFQTLRMTPIAATTVVLGKLKAAFLYVSIFLISSLPVLFSLAYLDYSEEIKDWTAFWRVGVWIAILILVTICFISAGLFASAFSRSTSSATAISYCFAAFICIVTLAALIPDAFTQKVQEILLTLNPIVAALRVTSDEMFEQLSDKVWVYNLVVLSVIALFFVAGSSVRVYYIFTRRS